MPQPQFLTPGSGPATVKFGGLALPNGQSGTMAYVNLNDLANWRTHSVQVENANRIVGPYHQTWLAKGGFNSDDWGPKKITIVADYDEGTTFGGAGLPISSQKALLGQAGTQYLTFDSLTAIQARLVKFGTPALLRQNSPWLWRTTLEFISPTPWATDLTSTTPAGSPWSIVNAPTAGPAVSVVTGGSLAVGTYTLTYTYVTASGETAPSPPSVGIALTSGNQQIGVSAVTLPGWATAVKWYFATGPTTGFTVQNTGGAFTLNTAGNGTAAPTSTPATSFSITYAGSVFAEPTFTLTIPNTNTATIQSLVLTNTMSNEALTVQFPAPLAASTAWTITISVPAWTVTDQTSLQYDVAGSFPYLYGPPGQANPFTAKLTPASGASSGVTLGASFSNRWEI